MVLSDSAEDIKNQIKTKLPEILEHYGCKRNIGSPNWECGNHTSIGKNSLSVDENDYICNCYGCKLRGDSFNVIAECSKLDLKNDFREIMKIASDITGIGLGENSEKITSEMKEERERIETIKNTHMAVVSAYPMSKAPEHIRQYVIKKRGISAEELDSLGLAYIPKELWDKNAIQSIVPESEKVFFENDGNKKYLLNTYYAMHNRIIHPHKYRGEILYMTGEICLDTETGEGITTGKYVKINRHFSGTGNAEGYNMDALIEGSNDYLIFSEGFWDTLQLKLVGIPAITFGTPAISNYFIERYYNGMRKFKKVVICFDTEDNQSGRKGALSAALRLLEKGIKTVYIAELAKDGGKLDIDEFMQKYETKEDKTHAVQEKIINTSIPYYEFLIKIIENSEIIEAEPLLDELLHTSSMYGPMVRAAIHDAILKKFKIKQKEINEKYNRILKEKGKVSEADSEEEMLKAAERIQREQPSDLRSQALALNQFSPAESVANLMSQFLDENPIYYDAKSHIFWAWIFDEKRWDIMDDIEVLRIFKNKYSIVEWINPAIKGKFLDSLRVLANDKPKDAPVNYIQFKGKVYDLKTEKTFDATHEYFYTNPIPHELGDSEDIPTIEKMITEWMTKRVPSENAEKKATEQERAKISKQALYETTAYTLLRAYPIQRVFVLHGEGANGKGTYLSLLRNLLGMNNVTTTDYDRLANTNQRFEKAKLLNKLVCQMGELEVSMFSKTSSLKELSSGTDLISAELKGKNPFDFISFAKIIIATNKLPMTVDKSDGFYRRFNIIDFPNQFSDARDILAEIPPIEYSNLARKCVNILKTLPEVGKFINDGSIEDRKEHYEALSNPLKQYIKDYYEEDIRRWVVKAEFKEDFIYYLKSNRFQLMNDRELTSALKVCGYSEKKQRFGNYTHTVILGIREKKSSEEGVGTEKNGENEDNEDKQQDSSNENQGNFGCDYEVVKKIINSKNSISVSMGKNVPDVPLVPLVLYRGSIYRNRVGSGGTHGTSGTFDENISNNDIKNEENISHNDIKSEKNPTNIDIIREREHQDNQRRGCTQAIEDAYNILFISDKGAEIKKIVCEVRSCNLMYEEKYVRELIIKLISEGNYMEIPPGTIIKA